MENIDRPTRAVRSCLRTTYPITRPERLAAMPLPRVQGTRILTLTVDPGLATPVYMQVYEAVRQAIVAGVLARGTRLPSTRALAADLGISRNTVVMAYDKLRGEGYAVGQVGSDTRVAERLPDDVLRPELAIDLPSVDGTPRTPPLPSAASQRISPAWLTTMRRGEAPPGAFRAAVPATDLFPYTVWGRLLSRRWSRITARDIGYSDVRGYLPLRTSIAGYLAATRGVRCTPEQIFLTSGAQGALSLAARLTIDPGDQAWVEDPGYIGANNALILAGASLVHVPVDAEGLCVETAQQVAPGARVAFVTPSRQMPLGVTLSPARRDALFAWAYRQRSFIIEDDYDSELRFASRPLPALHAADRHGSVLYVGTFSKVLFPALRIGYLVVPPELVELAMALKFTHDVHTPPLEQRVLTDFIEQGHFERHVRRLRQVYLERQQALRDSVAQHLHGILDIPPGEGVLSLIAWLQHGIADTDAARAAAAHGVELLPLSTLAHHPVPSGLVLGYAGLDVADIARGVERLARALVPLVPPSIHR